MDINKVGSNKKININNNFNPSEININNINVTKSNVNTNNLDKEVEYVDFSESNIKEEEYEEYLKEVEIYEKDLDTQKKDYVTELKYIEDRLAVLEWMTEIEPGEIAQHQLTGETLGYDKIAEEIKKEYNTKEKIEEYKQQLEEDQITLNAAIYKLEQLKKTAKYDNLKNLKEYQDFKVTTQHHQDEMDKQFDEYNKFAQKQKIEVDSSNYIDNKLALLIELNDEECIKIYNYLYEKKGKDEADKYLDDIKDVLHDQVGMLRAQEYLSKLEKDENGNYDNESIMNHLNTSIKGGITGVKSFFQGLNWFGLDKIYSTDEYETMYILQALQENKSFTNFLDNNFEISQSIGNMLPSVIIGQVACPLLGTFSMGASAGGNSYHQARVSGKSTGASISYGVLSGVSETTLQHFLGAIPGLNDVSVTSVKTFVQSMGKEGFEEFVQEYIDAGLQEVILNEKQDITEVTKNAGKSFIYGAITSGIFNTIQVGNNKISNQIQSNTSQNNYFQKAGDIESNVYMQEMEEVKQLTEIAKEKGMTLSELVAQSKTTNLITKEEINILFSSIIGEKLNSWIQNIESGYSLYTNLLEACSNADIEIADLKNSLDVLESMVKYYEDARTLQLEQKGEIFNTYRTHGIIHIFDVLTQSINAYTAFKNSRITDLSLNTVMLSAIMHDTGMSGGQQIKLSLDEKGKLVINTSEIESNGNTYRESHSFNSGVNILNEYETLRNYGYTDLEIAEAALLTFAHSKSNSGLNPLSGNISGWSFAIQALSKATEGSKFNIVEVLTNNNILNSTTTELSHNRINVKCPDGKVMGYIENYNLNETWLNKMGYGALIVRIGDALTNNDNAGTNQYGKTITFNSTNYNNQYSIIDIMKHFEVDTELSPKEQFEKLKEKLVKVAEYEAQEITYEVDGIQQGGSQQFVLGENNQTYKVETNKNGDVEVVVSIKNSSAIPFCTLFAIDERAGELNSKGTELFGITDLKNMKLVIEIDASTSETVKMLYKQYAEFYADIEGTVEVEIREVNNLAQIKDVKFIL